MREWLKQRPWIWLVVFLVVTVLANVALLLIAFNNPPVPIESFLSNLPPAQRAREAERLGVDPADYTAEALRGIELRPNEGI